MAVTTLRKKAKKCNLDLKI